MNIWVIAEQQELALELTGAARTLSGTAGEVITVLTGTEAQAQMAVKSGASKCYYINGEMPLENYAESLAEALKTAKPRLILIGATRRGKDLAAKIAALLGVGCATDGKNIEFTAEGVKIERMVYGGLAVSTLISQEETVIVTVPPKTYEAPAQEERTGEVKAFTGQPSTKVKVVEKRAKPKDAVNIADAAVVVGVGRGFAKQEDLKLAEDLAKVLEGELGCSRPVAEDLHWLPEDRYIGISGQNIKPGLYLSLGISGQVQHISGIRDAKIIFAVDKNENAPIFQNADYYIVGDLYQVVPALEEACKKALNK
ncbi:MAG: electron transfer flavoprotein subunit alpha/FixB family protein [Bacillota bacterium]